MYYEVFSLSFRSHFRVYIEIFNKYCDIVWRRLFNKAKSRKEITNWLPRYKLLSLLAKATYVTQLISVFTWLELALNIRCAALFNFFYNGTSSASG